MKHLLNLTIFLWLFVGVGVALGQYKDNYSDNYSDSTIYISTLDQALYREVSIAFKTSGTIIVIGECSPLISISSRSGL